MFFQNYVKVIIVFVGGIGHRKRFLLISAQLNELWYLHKKFKIFKNFFIQKI